MNNKHNLLLPLPFWFRRIIRFRLLILTVFIIPFTCVHHSFYLAINPTLRLSGGESSRDFFPRVLLLYFVPSATLFSWVGSHSNMCGFLSSELKENSSYPRLLVALLYMFSTDTQLPVYYRIIPGNISGMKALDTYIKSIWSEGLYVNRRQGVHIVRLT